jgi:hypothetical protein
MLSTDDSNLIQKFDSREQSKSIITELIKHARRDISFFGNNIDHTLFDNTKVIEQLSEFARRNQRTVIRFLVNSTTENSRKGHQLIGLSQRLTSSILIHTPATHQHTDKDMFLLVDDSAYAYFKSYRLYQGETALNNPLQVRKLRQRFDTMWDKSTVDTTVRRLSL